MHAKRFVVSLWLIGCFSAICAAQIGGGDQGNENIDGEFTSTETRVNGEVGDAYDIEDVVYWLANSTVEHDAVSPISYAAFAIQVRIFRVEGIVIEDLAEDQDSVFVLRGTTSPLNEDCSAIVPTAVPPEQGPEFLFCSATIRSVDGDGNVTYLDSTAGSFRRAAEGGVGN